jgi:hypothetical protein
VPLASSRVRPLGTGRKRGTTERVSVGPEPRAAQRVWRGPTRFPDRAVGSSRNNTREGATAQADTGPILLHFFPALGLLPDWMCFPFDFVEISSNVRRKDSGQSNVTRPPLALRDDSLTRYDSRCSAKEGQRGMASVWFSWSPLLVEIRREICPGARWQKEGRRWIMSETDAQAFLCAAQACLDVQRSHKQIRVDDTVWVVGFARGAPYQLTSPSAA